MLPKPANATVVKQLRCPARLLGHEFHEGFPATLHIFLVAPQCLQVPSVSPSCPFSGGGIAHQCDRPSAQGRSVAAVSLTRRRQGLSLVVIAYA